MHLDLGSCDCESGTIHEHIHCNLVLPHRTSAYIIKGMDIIAHTLTFGIWHIVNSPPTLTASKEPGRELTEVGVSRDTTAELCYIFAYLLQSLAPWTGKDAGT